MDRDNLPGLSPLWLISLALVLGTAIVVLIPVSISGGDAIKASDWIGFAGSVVSGASVGNSIASRASRTRGYCWGLTRVGEMQTRPCGRSHISPNRVGRPDLRRRICSWRKVEEAKSTICHFSLKLLILLALPRGIEPLFQP
jgi:hypothetical protein